MFRIIKKNINFFLLIILIQVSINSLNDFIKGDVNMNQKTSLNLEEINSNAYKGEKRNKFKLVKKQPAQEKVEIKPEKLDVQIANFRNPENVSDYVLNESDLNLNLVPVNERILFSGIPIPQEKPFPEERTISRYEVLTIKNKKELSKILKQRLSFIPNYSEIFDLINEEINFKVKNNLKLNYSIFNYKNEMISEIDIYKNNLFEVNARLSFDDKFISQYLTAPTERKISRYKVKVFNNISSSLKNLKIPKKITNSFINQFSFSIDFQRDIKDGDIIEILYEANYTSKGDLIGEPVLLYASLDLKKNQKIELFRYKMQSGKIDFFDSDGKSIRKSIMRTPINGARLSSRFGMRKHPILGYSKMHRGIDFAAKRGTPIMAAGDGRISFIGRNGSYGKFIEIKHLNGFSTRYGHLQKFQKKLKKGSNVKQGQRIGYVGNTGRSTGPHLHYEVKHNRRMINPMTLKLPSKIKVDEDEISNFYANISLTRERLSSTPIKNNNRLVNK